MIKRHITKTTILTMILALSFERNKGNPCEEGAEGYLQVYDHSSCECELEKDNIKSNHN